MVMLSVPLRMVIARIDGRVRRRAEGVRKRLRRSVGNRRAGGAGSGRRVSHHVHECPGRHDFDAFVEAYLEKSLVAGDDVDGLQCQGAGDEAIVVPIGDHADLRRPDREQDVGSRGKERQQLIQLRSAVETQAAKRFDVLIEDVPRKAERQAAGLPEIDDGSRIPAEERGDEDTGVQDDSHVLPRLTSRMASATPSLATSRRANRLPILSHSPSMEAAMSRLAT